MAGLFPIDGYPINKNKVLRFTLYPLRKITEDFSFEAMKLIVVNIDGKTNPIFLPTDFAE